MPPTVSIVIPTYNLADMLRSSLLSIREAGGPDYEVILADDGSLPPYQAYLDMLKEEGLCHQVVQRPENLGFAATCNDGIALAQGRYIVLLNNDVWVQPGWLEGLLDSIEREPGIGMVGPKLVYPNGLIESAGFNFDGWDAPFFFSWRFWMDPADTPEADLQTDVIAVAGACVLVPASVVKSIGGLDPWFFNEYEDVDWCFRIRQAGLRVFYTPRTTVTHYGAWTRNRDKASEAERRRTMREKFLQKWRNEPDLWLDPPILPKRGRS